MPRLYVAACCLLVVLPAFVFAEEPDAVYKQGVAKLRDAQADHAALVPATKLLAQAAALYEAAGDEAKTAEVNSCLYWAKKKFTLADTEAVKGDAVAVKRMETVAKAIPASEAKAMLEKAETFAKGHADDPLLTAIRYFEVGDRFPETAEGRKAIQQSLAAMQKVGEKAKLETYKPAPTDGKAFIKSEPAGAAIVLVNADGGKLDTGKVTPALVQLPVGKQSLELTLKGHKPATLAVEVDGKAIAKPDAATLEPLTVPVDVIFEDGWTVFVDGKPAKASGAGKAETPCTVELPIGNHELGLAKDGFMDIKQRMTVAEDGVKQPSGIAASSVEIKAKPVKGTSLFASIKTIVPLTGDGKSPEATTRVGVETPKQRGGQVDAVWRTPFGGTADVNGEEMTLSGPGNAAAKGAIAVYPLELGDKYLLEGEIWLSGEYGGFALEYGKKSGTFVSFYQDKRSGSVIFSHTGQDRTRLRTDPLKWKEMSWLRFSIQKEGRMVHVGLAGQRATMEMPKEATETSYFGVIVYPGASIKVRNVRAK